jgi:hypothetical protein
LEILAPDLVLQILAAARADGLLVLEAAPERGEVFLRGGKIVDIRGAERSAAATPSALRDALAPMLVWRSGRFEFRPGVESPTPGAALEVEGLLLDCVARLDRARGGAGEERGG